MVWPRESIGQMFLSGFDGYEPPEDIVDLVRRLDLGGVIVFRANLADPDQIARLTDSLQEKARRAPLLIAVDHEGGRVSRLPEPFTRLPPCRAVGRSGSADAAFELGRVAAEELLAVGINVNLAPVLDVDTNPLNPVIGDRSFGPDPHEVARLGLAVLKGFRQVGVIGCAKHFPGHGDTSQDSHATLPVVPHPIERLRAVELAPFRQVIRDPEGPEAVMSAHVLYPQLDAGLPATLSRRILTDLLRTEMGFEGLIVTDDLEMKAISERFGPEEACVRAIQAGADLVLFCHTPSHVRQCIEHVSALVDKGVLDAGRIRESLDRIRRLKARYAAKKLSPAERSRLLRAIGSPEHRAVAEKIKIGELSA